MHKALLLKLALIKATIFTTDYIHKLTHFCCPRSTMRSAFWSTQLVGWDCYKDVINVRVGDRGLCNSHRVLNMAEPLHEVWEMLDWFLGTETPVNQHDLNLVSGHVWDRARKPEEDSICLILMSLRSRINANSKHKEIWFVWMTS